MQSRPGGGGGGGGGRRPGYGQDRGHQGRNGGGYGRDGTGHGQGGFGNNRGARRGNQIANRSNTWKRKEGEDAGGSQGGNKADKAENSNDPKWEPKNKLGESEPQWGPSNKGQDPSNSEATDVGGLEISKNLKNDKTMQSKEEGNIRSHSKSAMHTDSDAVIPCGFCGYTNHATRDCRRARCLICGSNHPVVECTRLLAWNVGPELCAAQVEDQGFFYIEERIGPSVAKDKASTVVITVVNGSATSKQIENEFHNLIGLESWQWRARQVADDRFIARFPTAKLAEQWCHLKNLTMRNDAQLKIDAWAPIIDTKGEMQFAWFRVKNIPADQRSTLTLTQVGGLVGKVFEIDEGTRLRYDYVRMMIGCRDVRRVPKTAEAFLGKRLIDFGFERELSEGESNKILKSGIVVSDDSQPPAKKSRSTTSNLNPASNQGEAGTSHQGVSSSKGKQQSLEPCWSAPPNLNFKPRSQTKLMQDAQKALDREFISPPKGVTMQSGSNNITEEDEAAKVFIPEDCVDSDSDSDSFTVKVCQAVGMDIGQTSNDKDNPTHQTWFVQSTKTNTPNILMKKQLFSEADKSGISPAENTSKLSASKNEAAHINSPEVYLTEDAIINTQESGEGLTLSQEKISDKADALLSQDNTVTPEDSDKSSMATQVIENPNHISEVSDGDHEPPPAIDTAVMTEAQVCDEETPVADNNLTIQLHTLNTHEDEAMGQGRRRSERVKKQTHINTNDKVEKMARKRNLEGAYKEDEKVMLVDGVNKMMEIALKLLSKKSKKEGTLRIEDKADGHEGQEEPFFYGNLST